MQSYSPEEFYDDFGPCWTVPEIREMCARHGKERITLLDILECDDVSDRHAMWAATAMKLDPTLIPSLACPENELCPDCWECGCFGEHATVRRRLLEVLR